MYWEKVKILGLGALVLTAVFVIDYLWQSQPLQKAEIDRVVDGDTLFVVVEGELEKVRLIGIDAPESVNPNRYANSWEGRVASQHLKETLKNGDIVYLEKDPFVDNKDKYGRLLRYVWLCENLRDKRNLLNTELIRDGFAKYNSYGYEFLKYKKDFENAEKMYQGE